MGQWLSCPHLPGLCTGRTVNNLTGANHRPHVTDCCCFCGTLCICAKLPYTMARCPARGYINFYSTRIAAHWLCFLYHQISYLYIDIRSLCHGAHFFAMGLPILAGGAIRGDLCRFVAKVSS